MRRAMRHLPWLAILWPSHADELKMENGMRLDLAMRESFFAEDPLWPPEEEVWNAWPRGSPQRLMLEEVFTAIIRLYANMQGLLTGHWETFYSLAWPHAERNFPQSQRYFWGDVPLKQLKVEQHFKRLYAGYRWAIRRAVLRLDNSTCARRASRAAARLAAAGRGGVLSKQGLLQFRVRVVDEFFGFYALLAAGTWSAALLDGCDACEVRYHTTEEMKLERYSRRSVLHQLLNTVAHKDTQRRHCVELVQIGFGSGRTDAWLLESIPCLHMLSVDIQAKPLANELRRTFQNRSNFWQMSSVQAAERFARSGRRADLVFVDGSHSYQDVYLDLRSWWPLVRPHGILAGHDYSGYDAGVVAAVNEFVSEKKLELHLSVDHMWWLHVPPRRDPQRGGGGTAKRAPT
ncbi:unnamed protein product [Durusdinium trenchii]|uniref:Class I SAM-dependent methyltransferase n=1 Tax=Durusdinium trenchii TaxID=1381693 RepID=A0ABP0PGD2_9DINO